jgi:integrase
MAVYKRGDTWWYEFIYAGERYQESSKSKSKTIAIEAQRNRRRELEQGFNNISDRRAERLSTLSAKAAEYLREYKLRHKSYSFAEYAVGHVARILGQKMVVGVDEKVVKDYQSARLTEKAAPKSINEEVGFLLRLMGDNGDLLRVKLRKQKILKLTVDGTPGKAYDDTEKDKMLAAASASRSPLILPALSLALNAGMRDGEIKRVQWRQIDFSKAILTVGKSKTAAGEGRTIPLNTDVLAALTKYASWYEEKFRGIKPEWFVFPFGRRGFMDVTRPVTTLKTAWKTVKTRAGVSGRWHDARHTLITELAEGGAGDQTIMDIAGHVSKQMLARYSHIRTKAKREALEAVAAGRKKRKKQSDVKGEKKRSTVKATKRHIA